MSTNTKQDRKGPPPSESFALAFAKATGDHDTAWWVLSQLSIPPNLAYLRAGLSKAVTWLDIASGELDNCLAIIPGARLSAQELKSAAQRLIVYIDSLNWPEDDPRLQPIGRSSLKAKNPLHGDSKSVVHFWVNLFYTVEIDTSRPASDLAGDIEDYDSLMAGLSAYVIAAFSNSSAASYRRYCNDWHHRNRQPERPPIEEPGLFSRVESASHALRRVGLSESRSLFNAFRILPRDTPFHEKLRHALSDRKLSTVDLDELRKLEVLIESLRPGWQSRSRSGHTSRGTSRPSRGDGFVAIAESTLAVLSANGVEGEKFSLTYAIDDGEGDVDRPNTEADSLLSLPSSDDGSEWMPLADRLSGEPFVMMELDDSEAPLPSVSSRPVRSAWADSHLRRSQYAHRLNVTRCSRDECSAIHRCAHDLPPDGGETPRLVAIVLAALATGQSADVVKHLKILSGPEAEPPVLAYRIDLSCWELRILPPAWGDTDVTKCERPIEKALLLPDKVGFGRFLKAHGLDCARDLNIQKLTPKRRKILQSWLHDAAGDRHLRLSVVENALFPRVLEASGGDVAATRIITGRDHSHGASAAHYSYYSLEHLQSIYSAAMSDMFTAPSPKKPPPVEDKAREEPRHECGPGIGARRVPSTDSLAALLKRLRKEFRAAWKSGELVVAHNLFTTYTLVGLVLSVGLRAVVDPHLRDMAAAGRFVTFLDKARTDYHRRVAALPLMIVRQLLAYSSYLRRRMPHVMVDDAGQQISFAYVDPETMLHEPYRPKHFQAIVGDYYDLELYSLRRYFRTALAVDPSVSMEDLDAAMGHWWEGVSPHDPLSTYPMQRLGEIADGPVTALLRNVDYRVMEPFS